LFNKKQIKEMYEHEAEELGSSFWGIYNFKEERVSRRVLYFLNIKKIWLLRKFKDHIGKNDSVLEIGCADGFYTSKLLKITPAVHSIDVSQNYINMAEKHNPTARLTCIDIQEFEPAEKYDFVILSETLEHIPNEDMVFQVIEKCRPECVIITVPTLPDCLEKARILFKKNTLAQPGQGHVRTYNEKRIRRLINKTSFTLSEQKHFGITWPIAYLLPLNEQVVKLFYRLDLVLSNLPFLKSFSQDIGVVLRKQ